MKIEIELLRYPQWFYNTCYAAHIKNSFLSIEGEYIDYTNKDIDTINSKNLLLNTLLMMK